MNDRFYIKLERLAERVIVKGQNQDPVVVNMFNELLQQTEFIEQMSMSHRTDLIKLLSDSAKLRGNVTRLIKLRRLNYG